MPRSKERIQKEIQKRAKKIPKHKIQKAPSIVEEPFEFYLF